MMLSLFTIVLLLVATSMGYEDHKDVAFTVRRANIVDNSYIGFVDVLSDTNVGENYFNRKYGFFRVERPGIHAFNFQAVSGERNGFTISLRVDGVPQVFATAQRGYIQAGNSASLYLRQDQVVYLYLEEGSEIYEPSSYRGYTTFSGHRVTYDPPGLIAPRSKVRNRKVPRPGATQEEIKAYDNVENVIQKIQWQ